MTIAVWDTYVRREDGKTMHFDILVPENVQLETVLGFGQKYLENKSFGTEGLKTSECKLCHVEEATNEIVASIRKKGFSIIEIAHCT